MAVEPSLHATTRPIPPQPSDLVGAPRLCARKSIEGFSGSTEERVSIGEYGVVHAVTSCGSDAAGKASRSCSFPDSAATCFVPAQQRTNNLEREGRHGSLFPLSWR